MLQATEYSNRKFISWLRRLPDFSKVQHRRSLVWTSKAILLAVIGWLTSLVMIALGFRFFLGGDIVLGIVCLVTYPLIQIVILSGFVWLGYVLIQRPREKKIIARSREIIARHPGVKIAIAGSYGKTTMKEMLRTVLDEGLHVAASHGNMNTPLGLSRFVTKLDGSEDVLIFEYGEERPGDVEKLADITMPSIALMTGVSMAHLESFKTIENIADTIFEITKVPTIKTLYINGDDAELAQRAKQVDAFLYTTVSCGEWSMRAETTSLSGMYIVAKKNDLEITAHTALIGEHLLGPLVAVIAIADSLGLDSATIKRGIEQTKPFEHRMQPYELNGALIIDDTYNGNLKGVKAGLSLLAKVDEAKRKIYITPGLVEQGDQTEGVHQEIGRLIASCADEVVLMNNSVTKYIQAGLEAANFNGRITIIDDPLLFYSHLSSFVASGDVVLMQNDWTDNYH